MRFTQVNCSELIINGISLSKQQTEIVKHDGNIVVSASAGTGKTRTMVSKIVYDLERNKTHKVIAAITFTIKAAQEIRDRLVVDVSQNFIGTNNSFAIEEIIKPFMKDVYGEEYAKDFDTDYTNENYLFDSFNDGIEFIRSNGIISKYCTHRNCRVHGKDCSSNKTNFVFELALCIIKKSEACRLFLQAKYFGIYIDEYQDCDCEMHNLFMYICNNLGIRTFLVGDDKQSIYRWRGAKPDLFVSITKDSTFKHFMLTENHRSCKSIQNYSNLLFANTADLYEKSKNRNEIIVVDKSVDDWAKMVVELLNKDKSTALLRNANKYTKNNKGGAKDGAERLAKKGIDAVFIPEAPIEQITTKTAWLYMAVARFILLDDFTVFDFINEIPVEGDVESKPVSTIRKCLTAIEKVFEDKQKFSEKFKSISQLFGYTSANTSDKNIDRLFETVNDKQYTVSVDTDLPLHCAMSLHKSKGLEFDQAVIFLEDYAHNGKVEPSHINNHYVACTRAKSKLIIVDTSHSDAKAMCDKLTELFANVSPNDFLSKAPVSQS
ncbi:MAG: ATP-dependent helicase [Defluviitaleaceae bacterium]|nr:ATP-dependent helicase [Defluviitaleaceae bacterium]